MAGVVPRALTRISTVEITVPLNGPATNGVRPARSSVRARRAMSRVVAEWRGSARARSGGRGPAQRPLDRPRPANHEGQLPFGDVIDMGGEVHRQQVDTAARGGPGRGAADPHDRRLRLSEAEAGASVRVQLEVDLTDQGGR